MDPQQPQPSNDSPTPSSSEPSTEDSKQKEPSPTIPQKPSNGTSNEQETNSPTSKPSTRTAPSGGIIRPLSNADSKSVASLWSRLIHPRRRSRSSTQNSKSGAK